MKNKLHYFFFFFLISVILYGQLDVSFDGDGKVTTAIGTSSDYVRGVAIQPDGKIVVDGSFEYSDAVEIVIDSEREFKLSQNYPNPFNLTTMVSYTLPNDSKVKIEVTNLLGQIVGILVNKNKTARYYETIWNAKNLSSGIYLISIKAEEINPKKSFIQVEKTLLLK